MQLIRLFLLKISNLIEVLSPESDPKSLADLHVNLEGQTPLDVQPQVSQVVGLLHQLVDLDLVGQDGLVNVPHFLVHPLLLVHACDFLFMELVELVYRVVKRVHDALLPLSCFDFELVESVLVSVHPLLQPNFHIVDLLPVPGNDVLKLLEMLVVEILPFLEAVLSLFEHQVVLLEHAGVVLHLRLQLAYLDVEFLTMALNQNLELSNLFVRFLQTLFVVLEVVPVRMILL